MQILLSEAESQDYLAKLSSVAPAPTVIWQDRIQENLPNWGFDQVRTDHGGVIISPSDVNGANVTRVPDPAGGTGFVLRLFGNLTGGARAQVGIGSPNWPALVEQLKTPEGIWIESECFIPENIHAEAVGYQWMSLFDIHSTNADGSRRWHTCPGIMLNPDGSMRFQLQWGGESNAINKPSDWSTVPLPVGRWFKRLIHYIWSETPITLQMWIDDQPALVESGVITKANTHENVEIYWKLYGSLNEAYLPDKPHPPWVPTPTIIDIRNCRIMAERIWR